MTVPKEIHPIQRIRDEIGKLPEESNARRLSKVKDFAAWVGCSDSLIRNLENGVVSKFSEKLAEAIERETGVSARWMLSSPSPDQPILDRKGRPWRAERLDPFCYLPKLEQLLVACPTLLPSILAKIIEAQMRAEIIQGDKATLHRVLSLLVSSDFFEKAADPWTNIIGLGYDPRDEESTRIGIGLLMDQSPELSGTQLGQLEFLRSTEPKHPPESKLWSLFVTKAKRRLRRDFPNSKRVVE